LLTQPEKLARLHEEQVYPLFGQKLADLLVANLSLPARAHVLQIGCGLGTTTAEMLDQIDTEGRLIAVEGSSAFVERARARVPPQGLGRRVFFRAHEPDSKLPFAEDGFDCVLANVTLADLAVPTAFLAEIVRVTKPGGEIRLATPLAGTWHEFLDVYAEVLVRLRKSDVSKVLAGYVKSFPDPETVALALEAAGTARVEVESTHFELVFRTGREFFYAPVIEHGPLSRWKAIAGKGPAVQDTFLAVKEAIDTYFSGIAFGVSVVAGRFAAVKL